jgi:hypothetical protein
MMARTESPGHLEALASPATQAFAGQGGETPRAGARSRIHFAGDHCSHDSQGYMERAAIEGYRAACRNRETLTLVSDGR